jgi:capsule polysaccharide export protein KpsE/RkpR
MSNLYDGAAPIEGDPPKTGVQGLVGAGKTVWSALKETWGRLRIRVSFWSVVGAAAVISTVYYFVFAESLYDSQAIISVQNKSSSTSAVSSILSGTLGSGASASQLQEVQEYIDSMEMLKVLDKKFHLRQIYSSSSRNPFWRLWWPDTDEDFLWFYQYMVQIDNQSDVGIMTIDVLDYDKARAHALATEIVAQSEKFMNGINETMQTQTMKFAQVELGNAVKAVQTASDPEAQSVAELRLTAAQQALAAAEGSANQQNVFIVPISSPSYPTETTSPERLFNIISITFIAGIAYAVGFLMWSNVRDHRKA